MWEVVNGKIVQNLKRHWNEDFIVKICGIIATNCFELISPDGRTGVLVGLYETVSLMNHDCVGNARLVISEKHKISVHAR